MDLKTAIKVGTALYAVYKFGEVIGNVKCCRKMAETHNLFNERNEYDLNLSKHSKITVFKTDKKETSECNA